MDKELTECDLFNGFANRFLWPAVERSQLLPEGGQIDPEAFKGFAVKLREVLSKARKVRQMVRDSEAREHWHSIYGELTAECSGMLGAVTSRAEPQVLRLSMILALSDGSSTITLAHQKAALAIWNYSFQSANRFFGRKPSNAHALKILNVLRHARKV